MRRHSLSLPSARIALAGLTLLLGVVQAVQAVPQYAVEQEIIALGQGKEFGSAIALSGSTAAFADVPDAVNAGNDVYIYTRSGGNWSLQQALDIPDYCSENLIGNAGVRENRLALDGDTLVVGSPCDPTPQRQNQGSVRVYVRTGAVWTLQQKIDMPENAQGLMGVALGGFGASVSLQGDRLAVGALGLTVLGVSGVFVFERSGGVWSQTASILHPSANTTNFGAALSLSGDRLLIGNPASDARPSSRRALIYLRSGGGWQLEAEFLPAPGFTEARFGTSVALHGDLAVVGAPAGDGPGNGTAYVYRRLNGTWLQVQHIQSGTRDAFGTAVAVRPDRLAIGQPRAFNDFAGQVMVFTPAGLTWSLQQTLSIQQQSAFNEFGAQLAMSEEVLLAAAPNNTSASSTTDTGLVMAYRRLAPQLTLTPGNVNFGNVAVGGGSEARTVILFNSGQQSLTVSGISPATAPFARVAGGTCGTLLPLVLQAGSSCTLRYAFTPAGAGAAQQTITFTSNDPSGPRQLGLSGTGVTASLSINPAAAFIGTALVGDTVGPVSITFSNTGGASLDVTAIAAPAGPFALHPSGTCPVALPFTLGAGVSCTRAYTFSPLAPGDAFQSLAVSSTAPNGPAAFSLSGYGEGPNIALNFPLLDFGLVQVGAPSGVLVQTVRNTGLDTLEVQAITPVETPFERVGGDCPAAPFLLQPDELCTLAYRYTPEGLGESMGLVAVQSNAPDPIVSFSLRGEGAQPLLLLGNSPILVGSIRVGETSSAGFITLFNGGTTQLDIASIAGPTAPFEAAGGTCAAPPFVLMPGQSCTLGYRFTAPATGDFEALLLVLSNSPGSPDQIVLRGRGSEAILTLTPAPAEFGRVDVDGAGEVISVEVGNAGDAKLEIQSIGSASAPFTVLAASDCPDTPFFIEGGTFCTLVYRFAPSTKGLVSQSLPFTHDGDQGPTSLQLRGIGAPGAPLVTPDPLDFGNVDVDSLSALLGVSVQNQASVTLDVGTVALDAGVEFDIDQDGCSGQSLAPSAQCTIGLRFLPAVAGQAQDLLQIDSDAVGAPSETAVQGIGVDVGIFRDGFEQL